MEKDKLVLAAHQLNNLVDLLVKSGLQKKQVADELGINGKGKNSVLFKLCNGLLQSYNGVTTQEYIDKIHANQNLSKKLNSSNIDASLFEAIFFFYYWSSKKKIKTAVIGINLKNLKESRFFYLDRQENGIHTTGHTHDIKLFEHENSSTIDIVMIKKSKGATFISAHIGNKNLDEIGLSFCSYCGAMLSNQVNYAGIGILEYVNKDKFNDYLDSLNLIGIHPGITNSLYRRRLDVHHSESDVYASYEALNSSQKEPLKHLTGYWVGYYLRRMIEGPEKSGGIVKVIMEVEESGISTIDFIGGEYRDNGINERTTYTGIFQFPVENSISIIVGEFEHAFKAARLRMLLKYDDRKLTGDFSGWRIIDSSYFTTAIYFEKIDLPDNQESRGENLKELFELHKPSRYHRSNISEKLDDSGRILKILKEIENRVFDTVENCTNFST